MPLSTTDLRTLAARGSTLWERLAGAPVHPAGDTYCVGDRRLRAWVSSVGRDDPPDIATARFERRLRWAGWDAHVVRPLLGPLQWDATEPLPTWVDTLY